MIVRAARTRILAQLAAAENTGTMTSSLCRLCVEVAQLSGAGVMLSSDGELRGLLCHSDEISGQLGDLEYELGEGPGLEAITHGCAVLEPDLVSPMISRWVAFTGPAVDAGARAVFSFPLHIGTARLGALDLYRDQPGPLTVAQHAQALFMAEIATEAVLAAQAGASPGALAWGLDDGAHFHYVVQQAAGIVAVQLGVTVADALVRLRAYSFGNERPLDAVARDTVDHTLRFTGHDDHDG
ncbi:MAG: ANTAR domain-containing protein [Ilumatobacteraceae bacterium]